MSALPHRHTGERRYPLRAVSRAFPKAKAYSHTEPLKTVRINETEQERMCSSTVASARTFAVSAGWNHD